MNDLIPELNFYSKTQKSELALQSSSVKRYLNFEELDHLSHQNHSPSFSSMLRSMRHQAWLRAAFATFFGTASTADICLFWSSAANHLLEKTWNYCGLNQTHSALVALGKLGAQELNLSSDVDLLVIAENEWTGEMDKSLRKFRTLLSENTDRGFVLRLDFDLRPGGRWGPLVSTLTQTEDYYWSQGETWERLALVRARILQGPTPLTLSLQELFQRFCYRKFLDYTLLDDLQRIRHRIQQYNQFNHQNEFNLKLGRGGIRDIELFVHALQVIHGGKDHQFRTASTTQALTLFAQKKILPLAEAQTLLNAYWRLRHLEHRIQLEEDQQIHSLSFHHTTLGVERHWVNEIAQKVNGIVTTLLGEASPQISSLSPSSSTSPFSFLPDNFEEQKQWLRQLEFSTQSIEQLWSQLTEYTVRSTKVERDEAARKRFLYDFVLEVSKIGLDKNLALSLLLDLIQSIRAKATFFTLFNHQPRLIKDLARLFSISPYLGQILARRPELLDGFLFRQDEKFSVDLENSLEEMAEHRLLTEIIAANQFLGDHNSILLGRNLSSCADYICTQLLERLDAREEEKKIRLVALGKWGGLELGFRSDLDLILVTKNTPNQQDQKIARRFINRLNDVHKGGKIYSVDLRLRPSGKAGPLILSEDQWSHYLTTKAAPWERQAYLRSRPLSPLISNNVSFILEKGLTDAELHELNDIRQKVLKTTENNLSTDLKYSPGGLIDVELAIQTRLLADKINPQSTQSIEMIEFLIQNGTGNTSELITLKKNYMQLRKMEQLNQLTCNHSGSQIKHFTPESERLSQLLQISQKSMFQNLDEIMKENSSLLKNLDPIYTDF